MIFNVGAGGASKAEQVKYDNSKSGLEATELQGAVDELKGSVSDLNDSLEGVSNNLSVLGNCEILVYNIKATGNQTFTRNINDYRYVLFVAKAGDSNIRGTTLVPIHSVLNGEVFFVADVVAPSTHYSGAKYVGNNTFNFTEYVSANNARGFSIYGVK